MMNILEISTVDAKKVLASLEEEEDVFPGQKRRRLENLSTEERTLRRKLKNRVAAQTARDRKKAHMEELEVAVTRFETENKLLKQSNEDLRSQVHSLLAENQQLRIKLGLTPPVSPSSDYTCLTAPRTANLIQEIIITPSVDDHANLVIKKEELSIVEHASLYNACTQRWTLFATILLSLVTTLAFRIQRLSVSALTPIVLLSWMTLKSTLSEMTACRPLRRPRWCLSSPKRSSLTDGRLNATVSTDSDCATTKACLARAREDSVQPAVSRCRQLLVSTMTTLTSCSIYTRPPHRVTASMLVWDPG